MTAICVKAISESRRKYALTGNIRRYLTDVNFRARVSLTAGFAVNLFFALFRFISGIVIGSEWAVVTSVYYTVICLLKILLIRGGRNKPETLSQLWCAISMLSLNTTLSLSVYREILSSKDPGSNLFIIIVSGSYTLYRLILTAVGVIRKRHIFTPVIYASKFLNISVLLVSLLTFTTDLISRNKSSGRIFILLGAAADSFICLLLILIALFTLIKSIVDIKRIYN